MSVLRAAGAVAFLGLAACGPEAQTQQEAPLGAAEKALSAANLDSRYTGYPYANPTTYHPNEVPMYPLDFGRPTDRCRQQSYVQMHFNSPLYANSTIFFAGVVAPSTKVNFHIYDSAGNLVKTHQTHFSGSNCVITQENEYDNLGNLSPGTYDVFASFWYIGAYLNGGWYTNGGLGPLAYNSTFIGSITVQ